jgi:aconitate hydratase
MRRGRGEGVEGVTLELDHAARTTAGVAPVEGGIPGGAAARSGMNNTIGPSWRGPNNIMDSFGTIGALAIGGVSYTIRRLDALTRSAPSVERLPFTLKILLENLLRHEDGRVVKRANIESILEWRPHDEPSQEIPFHPERVLLQDFTGVPAIVDLALLREALGALGGDPSRVSPLHPVHPVDLVIDHSVQVDAFATINAYHVNVDKEIERNRERYSFLRWGARAFRNLRVIPPGTGICHQVDLEYLSSVVRVDEGQAFPDTLVGADSHTTMVNGAGVLGWGVGGIEAEAAMLGQPTSMLVPQVLGVRLRGARQPGVTATDLVLTIAERLRRLGVVGKFVEFFGPGLASLSVPDRATIGNMSPEFGATCAFFPVDDATLDYLRLTGRRPEHILLVEAYCKAQGIFRTQDTPDPVFSSTLDVDLGDIEPSIAGPRRPQDRIALHEAKRAFRRSLLEMLERPQLDQERVSTWLGEGGSPAIPPAELLAPAHGPLVHAASITQGHLTYALGHGAVVIAAITSCTNTSNPAVMIAAGLLAKKAVERGCDAKPWVKTSLAPGSRVVTDYLDRAGLTPYLEALGFHLVGYGCTTCIGNSGPLPQLIADAITKEDLVVASVLSGNRNFEGRINELVRMNYLMSPPLVVAYALAGNMDVDLTKDPLCHDRNGTPVYLRDVWPSDAEIQRASDAAIGSDQFSARYAAVLDGDEHWKAIDSPAGDTFAWDPQSTYVRRPPFLDDLPRTAPPPRDIVAGRVLALLGDSVTTDHISPAGAIALDSPAARYLVEHGVQPQEFNSYGSRRGNHDVMMRGTFANVRLRNQMVPGVEGPHTLHHPSGDRMFIFDAAMRYRAEGAPLIVIAGAEYGTGSSRDWAAKGPCLLGVRAVIAKSFERIHRSNLIGMGVLPLQFVDGEDATSLGLDGSEVIDIVGLDGGDAGNGGIAPGKSLVVRASRGSDVRTFNVVARIDTPRELDYFTHGGILPFVLREFAGATAPEG